MLYSAQPMTLFTEDRKEAKKHKSALNAADTTVCEENRQPGTVAILK